MLFSLFTGYRLLESGDLFEDPEFPPDESSLNLEDDLVSDEKRENLSKIEWVSHMLFQRPNQKIPKSKFLDRPYGPWFPFDGFQFIHAYQKHREIAKSWKTSKN